jgi:hypothetical protein
MKTLLEWERKTLDQVIDYISQFKTTEDFYKSPKANSIRTWVSSYRGPEGEKIYISDLLSGLEKNRSRKEGETTEKLQQMFPQWDFSNVTYKFKTEGVKTKAKILDGLYCPIEDENGVPHGISNDIRVTDLIVRGSGCRKCGIERTLQSIKLDFSKWIEEFPKDKGFIFDINNFYYREEGLSQKTAFVKDVICTKHDPFVVFAKNGVNIHNLRLGKSGCPICGKSESKGETKVIEELNRLGYDVSKQKRFPGCFGFEGTRYCDLLKFDSYIVKKDGTEVCVEYDGIQHFEPQKNWGGEDGLKSLQKRDNLKNEYCEKNNIKLIRIPYWDYENIGKILEDELGYDSNEISKPNIKKEYIVTESQLKKIVDQTSNEKLEKKIKELITSTRDYVLDVKFFIIPVTLGSTEGHPTINRTVIEVIFDKSKVTFNQMRHFITEIEEDIDSFFELGLKKYGSNYQLNYKGSTKELK